MNKDDLIHLGDVMNIALIPVRGALRDAGLLPSVDNSMEVLQGCIDALRELLVSVEL